MFKVNYEALAVGGIISFGLLALLLGNRIKANIAHAYATSSTISYLGQVPAITNFAAAGDFGDSADTPKVLGAMKAYPVIFLLGDLAYDKGTSSKVDAWYNKYMSNYSGQKWMCLGNEDNSGSSSPAKYKTLFGVTDWNYSFDSGITHFLSLNTESLPPKGAIESDLAQAKQRGVTWIIVFLHKPVKTPNAKHRAENTWLTAVFEAYGVDMILQGHNHFYVRYAAKLNKDGNNTYYFVAGLGGRDKYVLSGSLPSSVRKFINNRFGYMKIAIANDGISTRYMNTAGEELDKFTIKKLTAPTTPMQQAALAHYYR